MEKKLIETGKKIWADGFFYTERGLSLLETKRKLYNLNEESIANVKEVIGILDEALNYLNQVTDGKELTEFANSELREFCEIKKCSNDIDLILNTYQQNKKQSENDTPTKSITSKEEKNTIVAMTPTPEDEQKKSHYETLDEKPRIHEKTITNDNVYWVHYKNSASQALTELSNIIQSASNSSELLKINISKKVCEILDQFEIGISETLLKNGNLDNPKPYFQSYKSNLLDYTSNFQKQLSLAIIDNNYKTQYFKDQNQSQSGYSVNGSIGFVASVATVNSVKSIFSGISRHNQNRQFANQLDKQLWNEIQPILNDIYNNLADVIVDYYSIISDNLGLIPFDEMLNSSQEAEYILDNLDKIDNPDVKANAINQAFHVFPFQGKHWLDILTASALTPEKNLELIHRLDLKN